MISQSSGQQHQNRQRLPINPMSKLGMSKAELAMALDNLDNDINIAANLICNSTQSLVPDELIDNQRSFRARSLAAQRLSLAMRELQNCTDRIQSIRHRMSLPKLPLEVKIDDITL